MKLRTEIARLTGDDAYFEDMQALEHERTYSESVDKLSVRWIRLRADEILAGWLGEDRG